MFDILFARTFLIVGSMLLITALTAYLNKDPKSTGWGTIIMSFILLFAIISFSNSFPLNIILVGLFAAIMGWMISSSIKSMGENFKVKKFLKENGITLKKGDILSEKQLNDLEEYLTLNKSNEQWNKIVSQAMISSALAIFVTASLAFFTDIDFGFMGIFLFIGLIILIIMGILNIFIFKSRIFSLVKAYFGVLIFTLYLIYDFNRLEKMQGDESWGTAIDLAVNIYLDIINLFLYLLEIFGDSN